LKEEPKEDNSPLITPTPQEKAVLKFEDTTKKPLKKDESSSEDDSLRIQMIRVCDKKPKQHPGFLPTRDFLNRMGADQLQNLRLT